MKKILAALLVASFGAGLMAQQLVYEYKASIKRLDPTFQVKSNKSGKFVAQSYKVASDTISGYVILPACVACANGLDKNMSDYDGFMYDKDKDGGDDHSAKGYFIRKGDKLSKANVQFEDTWEDDNGNKVTYYKNLKKGSPLPYVLQTTVEGAAALFGAYQQLGPSDADKPQSDIKAANKAWMRLEYYLPSDAANINPEKVLKGIGYDIKRDGPLYIGFLGLTNYGTYYDDVVQGDTSTKVYNRKVYHTGFGTAQETSTIGTTGWCANTKGKSCIIVKSITGALVGYPYYQGVCYVTPMWDVCYAEKTDDGNPSVVNDAVIYGSWTLKYNKNVTEKYNSANGDKNSEIQVILDQFGKKIGQDRIIKLGLDGSTYKPLYDGTKIL